MSHTSVTLQRARRTRVGATLTIMFMMMSPCRAEAAGTLYWSSDYISRGSTDGDCRQTIRSQESNSSILDLDVDLETNKLYFIYQASIRRCGLDGGNSEELVAALPQGPGAAVLDIDRVNGKLYWTVNASPPNRIMRSNLDGSNVELVFSGDFPNPFGIAVDPAGGKVYWTHNVENLFGAIHRVNFDGTMHEQIVLSGQEAAGIAVHHASGKVYWADGDAADATPGGVYRANLDFSNVEQVVSGLPGLREIDIDEAAGMLYLAKEGGPWLSLGIYRCDLNGGGLERIFDQYAYGMACVSEQFGFECPGDLNADLSVNVQDLLSVIGSWGPCRSCESDFNGDGIVNVQDLLYVVNHWTS